MPWCPGAAVTPVNGGPSITIAQFPGHPPAGPVIIPPAVITPVVTLPITPIVVPPSPPKPPTPPINIAGLAGAYYHTGAQGTVLGFSGPGSPYAEGKVVNGRFSANGRFGAVSFPLSAGGTVLARSGAGTTSPLGPVTGATYLSPDGSFFFADLAPVREPAQREFIYGGQPIGANFTAAAGPRVLAFAVVPGWRSGLCHTVYPAAGGRRAHQPQRLAADPGDPGRSVFSTSAGATKALQASLAINGTGAGKAPRSSFWSATCSAVGRPFKASFTAAIWRTLPASRSASTAIM